MSIEIKVPVLPESVTDATVAKWYKKEGETVARDENLVDLETDKVMLEVPSPKDGVIKKIMAKEGQKVTASEILVVIEEGGAAQEQKKEAPAEVKKPAQTQQKESTSKGHDELSPSVRRLVAEKEVDVSKVAGSGKDGRVTKQDVESHLNKKVPEADFVSLGSRTEKRVPMSRIRQRIAERLVKVQHEAAILTTFNEVNMQPVMNLRQQYRDAFEKAHGVRLGFMSFFTKAAVEALKRFPAVNASIDGSDIVYHNYYDIGIAIGTPRGLVVPILRHVENMGMADIEKEIRAYADRAQEGRLSIEELTGGTFSITNGGTYGSMLSTPIINAPQTAILGMHNITERAVVEKGQVVVRPMMYLALSYDHRVIDGREAVSFLVAIKEMLEEPARMLLEV